MATSICHVEINVSNVDAAQKFYSELFGWTFESWGDQPYRIFRTGGEPGAPAGGISGFGGPTGQGGTLVYVLVDEIEPYIEKAKALGGGVSQEKILIDANIGWSAVITDPDGNTIGLFKRPR